MSLLDPKWKYTHSTATDIRKTFAKARRALGKKAQVQAQPPRLQLMRAAPIALHTRASDRKDGDHTAPAAPRAERCIASW